MYALRTYFWLSFSARNIFFSGNTKGADQYRISLRPTYVPPAFKLNYNCTGNFHSIYNYIYFILNFSVFNAPSEY